jgi:hypothetical protein
MKQREVQDGDNTKWVCVEALSGITETRKDIEAKTQDENGNVTVVCTPSGGAQTVRLQLSSDWTESISDEALLQEIANNK